MYAWSGLSELAELPQRQPPSFPQLLQENPQPVFFHGHPIDISRPVP